MLSNPALRIARPLDIILGMTNRSFLIIGILTLYSTIGQAQNHYDFRQQRIIEEKIFYLVSSDENIELDSLELRMIDPNWIKSINIVRPVENPEQDHTTSNNPSTANIYIELKKGHLKKYLIERREKNNDI